MTNFSQTLIPGSQRLLGDSEQAPPPRSAVPTPNPQQSVFNTRNADGTENPFLLDQERQRRAVIDSFEIHAKNDPHLMAQALDAGWDLTEAQRNPDLVLEFLRKKALQDEINRTFVPSLQRMVSDPEFAAIAFDDARNLAETDSIASYWNAGRAMTRRGYIGVRIGDKIARGEEPSPADLEEFKEVERQLALLPRASRRGWFGWFFTGAVKTIGQQWEDADLVLGTAATTAGVGSFIPGVGTGFGFMAGLTGGFAGSSYAVEAGNLVLDQLGGDAFGLSKDEAIAHGIAPGIGVDRSLALRTSIYGGMINAGLEVFGGKLLLSGKFKDQVGRLVSKEMARDMLVNPNQARRLSRFLMRTATGVAGETATETAQELTNIIMEEVTIAGSDPSQLDQEEIERRPAVGERLAEIVTETIRGTLLIGAAGPVHQLYKESRRAAVGRETERFVDNLRKNVQESKVNGRSKDRHEQAVEQAFEQSEAESVFVDVERFEAAMQEAGVTIAELERLTPEIAQRLQEARQTGSVEIPTHTYGAQFLSIPGGLGEKLAPDIRVTPDAASPREAQAITPEQEAQALEQAEKLIRDTAVDSRERRDQLRAVEKTAADQIARSGFSRDQARTAAKIYAAHVGTMANELGITVEEYQAARGVTFTELPDAEKDPTVQAAREAAQTEQTEQTEQPEQPEQPAETEQTPETERAEQPEADLPAQDETLQQEGERVVRGRIRTDPTSRLQRIVELNTSTNPAEGANFSTLMHEMAHAFFMELTDLVNEGLATQQMRDDLDTTLQWFEIGGDSPEARLTTWNAMDLEAQREHHEALALGFEQYTFDGKAPTKALQRVFNRFRKWLLVVYKALRRDLNVQHRELTGQDLPMLTEDVRRVMDRMLASAEEVQVAELEHNMVPFASTLEEFVAAGFDEAAWPAYQEAVQEAHDAAITDLTKANVDLLRWHTRARSKAMRKIQRETSEVRKEVEKEVRADLEGRRVYIVTRLMRESEDRASKLNLGVVRGIVEALAQRLSDEVSADWTAQVLKRFGTHAKGVMSVDGTHPDLYARNFGYDSGDQMVQDMAMAAPLDEAVEIETTRRLEAEFSELTDPSQIERRVEEALHDEARARFLRHEMRVLTGGNMPVRAQKLLIERAARQTLSRRPIKQIKPTNFSRLEAAAARNVLAAIKSGDILAAVQAKYQQMLANEMTRQSILLAKEIEKTERQLRSVATRSDRRLRAKYNMDFVNVGRVLMSRIAMLPPVTARRAAEQLRLMQENAPDAFAQFQPVLATVSAEATNYRDMTVEEFQEVTSVVDGLFFAGRRDKGVMIEGQVVAVGSARDQLLAMLDIPETRAGQTSGFTKAEKIGRALRGTRASLTRMEHLFRFLDGGKTGPWLTFLHDPIKQALDKYRSQALVFTQRLIGIVRSVTPAQQTLHIPELNYTFGVENGGVGIMELIGALLHTGNLSNKKRLVASGRGENHTWGTVDPDGNVDFRNFDQGIQNLVDAGTLREEHYDLVQSIWDLMEEIKPTLQEAHRAITGTFFHEVTAEPFTVTFPQSDGSVKTKTYRGGYVPATPSALHNPSVRQVQDRPTMAREFTDSMPATPSSFTKERSAGVPLRPLELDLQAIAGHIDQALRYAHVQPPLTDVQKILSDREFQAKVNQFDPEMLDAVDAWLDRAAAQTLYKKSTDPTAGAFWRWIRRATGVSIMMLNPINALQQLTGLSNSFAFVKKGYMVSAMAQLVSGRGLGDAMRRLSPMMDERTKNQVFGLRTDLQELITKHGWVARSQEWTLRHAYWVQGKVQNLVDIATWTGAFNQHMVELPADLTGEARERAAVKEADRIVRLAQGSFNPEDVARYEVGSDWHRTWIQFTGYFNNTLNTVRFTKDSRVRAAILAYVIPMMASEAIVKEMWDQWDEDDDGIGDDLFYDVLLAANIRGLAPMVPAFGPGIQAVLNAGSSQLVGATMGEDAEDLVRRALGAGRTSGRDVASSAALTTIARAAHGFFTALAGATTGEEISGRNVRDALTAVTLMSGLPLSAAGRPAQFFVDTQDSPTEGAYDFLRGVLSGRVRTER